jgi:ABC-type glycerol-3-phosphate transport system substrate-binding protein
MKTKAYVILIAFILSFCLSMSLFGGSQSESASEEEISIEIFERPIIGDPLPPPEEDPYRQYLNNTLGAKFELSRATDFMTELTTRFVSKDPPDLICFNSQDEFRQLYAQGVLLADWYPYLDGMPTASKEMGEFAKKYFETPDGELMAITHKPNGQKWAFEIRKDWMQALNLDMPTTPEELLEVARAFTFGDPDKDGKNNTYAFTSAGSGNNLGEIRNLMNMFTPPSFYITDDGKVSHPVLNGGHEKFVKWMRTVVSEALIDPDWYTQAWSARKPALFQGRFGVVWYPPMALLNEIDIANGGNSGVEKWWSMLPVPKGSELGGKLPPAFNPVGFIRTVPATLEANERKMEVVVDVLELTSPGNDGCHKMMYGRDIDGFTFIDMGDGYWYYDRRNAGGTSLKGEGAGQYKALWDWARPWIYEDPFVIQGSTPEPGPVAYAFLEMEKELSTYSRHAVDYFALSLDPTTNMDVQNVTNEFEIKYVLGDVDNYEDFRKQWLSVGGQKLLDQATEQFREKGMID